MEPILTFMSVILAIAVGVMLIWLFPLKLVTRLRRKFGKTSPCSFRFAWALDLRFRRWIYRFIVDRLDLRCGMIVVEIGAGTGNFVESAARRVGPTGKVIAVDLQPEMIVKLDRRIRLSGITNVETHVADAKELPLQDASVDYAFFIAALGEIADPQRALDEVHLVLKQGGVVSITEDFFDPDYNWPSETVRLISRAGFEATERFGTFWLYTLNGRKA